MLNFWRPTSNRQFFLERRKKVGAPLPLGIGASLACSPKALPGLKLARCSGALFYCAKVSKVGKAFMRKPISILPVMLLLILSSNYLCEARDLRTPEVAQTIKTGHETVSQQYPRENVSINKTKVFEDQLRWWNSTINIGRWETKPITIAIIISVIVLIIIVGIAIKKTIDGTVIFFSSYFDLFLSFLPFIVLVISLIVIDSKSEEENLEIPTWAILAAIIAATLYNYIKACLDNRHAKFLAFCVGTGRITLGYLLPIIIILSLLELFSGREEKESKSEWITRKVTSGLILGGAAAFLHSLIGYSRWRDKRIEEIYQKVHNPSKLDEMKRMIQLVDSMPENPYEVLNIPQNATKEEIKKAYRKLAHQYHPDKTAQLGPEIQEVAHRKMQEINAAYELLTEEKNDHIGVEGTVQEPTVDTIKESDMASKYSSHGMRLRVFLYKLLSDGKREYFPVKSVEEGKEKVIQLINEKGTEDYLFGLEKFDGGWDNWYDENHRDIIDIIEDEEYDRKYGM